MSRLSRSPSSSVLLLLRLRRRVRASSFPFARIRVSTCPCPDARARSVCAGVLVMLSLRSRRVEDLWVWERRSGFSRLAILPILPRLLLRHRGRSRASLSALLLPSLSFLLPQSRSCRRLLSSSLLASASSWHPVRSLFEVRWWLLFFGLKMMLLFGTQLER